MDWVRHGRFVEGHGSFIRAAPTGVTIVWAWGTQHAPPASTSLHQPTDDLTIWPGPPFGPWRQSAVGWTWLAAGFQVPWPTGWGGLGSQGAVPLVDGAGPPHRPRSPGPVVLQRLLPLSDTPTDPGSSKDKQQAALGDADADADNPPLLRCSLPSLLAAAAALTGNLPFLSSRSFPPSNWHSPPRPLRSAPLRSP